MKLRHCLQFVILAASVILTSCTQPPPHQANGYIEGKYTYLATSVSGAITQMFVDKGAEVKQGDLLIALEAQPESDIYNAAVENLQQATKAYDAIVANLEYARLTYERYKVLVPKKAIQQSQLDNAHAVYESTTADLAKAKANIASVRAALAEAKWRKEQKNIYAPVNGFVFDTYYRLGENTEAHKPILSFLAPSDIKVVFYISAADLGAIKLRDEVTLRCSNCAKDYIGKISFIAPQAEYTPPVIYSTETSDKLVFRIEANFKPEDAKALHPGMPAIVMYHAHG